MVVSKEHYEGNSKAISSSIDNGPRKRIAMLKGRGRKPFLCVLLGIYYLVPLRRINDKKIMRMI